MACEGAKPVVAIYSTFLQRGYDQLIHDVAMQNLDVLFAIDRGGVVGPDGATHAGSLDLSYLRCMPNMVVMAPADENECRQMLSTGFRHEARPRCAIRAAPAPASRVQANLDTLADRQGRSAPPRFAHRAARVRRDGAGRRAGRRGLDLTVVNMRFVKPLDRALLLELAQRHDGFVTLEDNVVDGRRRQRVAELLSDAEGIALPILHLGLPDAFQHHASREDLLAEAGLDAAGIRASLLQRWPELATPRSPHAAQRADRTLSGLASWKTKTDVGATVVATALHAICMPLATPAISNPPAAGATASFRAPRPCIPSRAAVRGSHPASAAA